ncbi:MAG: hypothetical protein ACR2LV_05005 [Solirubrobacteraceae bacterium]
MYDNDIMVAQLADRRGRNLDHPGLALYNNASVAWGAWAPSEALTELRWEAQDVIDAAGAALGYMCAPHGQRMHAWQTAGGGGVGTGPAGAGFWRPDTGGSRRRTVAAAPRTLGGMGARTGAHAVVGTRG